MLEKYIFLQKFSWYLPKNGQFYDQIWLSNTIEYWGRIRFSVEYIQFWKVGFEWRQNSRIFVEYAVFEYSGTPLASVYQTFYVMKIRTKRGIAGLGRTKRGFTYKN